MLRGIDKIPYSDIDRFGAEEKEEELGRRERGVIGSETERGVKFYASSF